MTYMEMTPTERIQYNIAANREIEDRIAAKQFEEPTKTVKKSKPEAGTRKEVGGFAPVTFRRIGR